MKKRLLGLLFMTYGVFASNSELLTAKQGAPAHISDNASLMVWEDGEYKTKVKGSNEFSCLIWADEQGTFEPSCFNAAAIEAVLPVYQYQRKMLEKGMKIEDIHSNIAKKAETGHFPSPQPGAVVYMMSKQNKFYDHFGNRLVNVKPHLMLYSSKLNAESLEFNGKEGLPGFYSDYPHLSVIHIHTSDNH